MTDMLKKLARAIGEAFHNKLDCIGLASSREEFWLPEARAAIETTGESILMAVRRACTICESSRPVDDDTCPYCGSIVEAIKEEIGTTLEGRG